MFSRTLRGAGIAVLAWAALALPALARPYPTLVNEPFATVCAGPQGAILDSTSTRAVGLQSVGDVVATQHPVASLQRATRGLTMLVRHGAKPPRAAARARFPRLMYRVNLGRLVLPNLVSAMQTGTGIGNPTNRLTFQFEGWSAADQTALNAYLTNAYPKIRLLYGPPAFNMTVKVVRDTTIHPLQGGVYNASTNEIRLPPLSGNFPEDTFVLCLMVLHAFRDDAALYYDAWEYGMAGAAATVIQSMPGVAPGYDPVDPGPFYAWSVYECENQPALANNTFYPASGFSGMLAWRIAMARTVWLKAWAEDNTFFSNFNQAYYAGFRTALPGDVPALKEIAATVLPQVEGLPFHDWFMRQYILDTSIHTGLKLYTWNAPLEDAVILVTDHYLTTAEGDESPRSGTPRLIYWNFDYTLSLYSEEGNVMPTIAATGPGAGETQLIPSFSSIGGPQRITIQLDVNGLRGYYPYAYGVRGFNPRENNFWGAVMGGPQATLDVTGIYTRTGLTANRGVWGTILGGGPRLTPGQISVVVTNPLGQQVERKLNVGWDGYTAFLPGGGQAGLTHTFRREGTGIRMISLPVEPVQPNASALLGVSPDRLLLARWDPTLPPDGGYQIWPRLDPFAPGRGYWIRLYSDLTINVQGLLPPEDRSFLLDVPLGWSMVGSPRRGAVSVSNLQVQVGTGDPIPFAEAVASGWLQEGFYAYNPVSNAYNTAPTLQTFEGYWLRCLLPGGVRVIFPPA